MSVIDDEPVRWTVVGEVPFLGVVPLKVQLNTVAAYAGISRPLGVVSECHLETEVCVELDGRLDVA